jgi:DNA-binding NarL/FixJ family response regulator
MGATVLAVDDQPISRMGVCALLGRETCLTVVGEADAAESALCLAGELAPDLVVQDLWIGGDMAGARLCKELK